MAEPIISETIFDGKNVVFSMADIQHIEKKKGGIWIITDKTKWNYEHDDWENPIWIDESQVEEFFSAWKWYQYELELLRRNEGREEDGRQT